MEGGEELKKIDFFWVHILLKRRIALVAHFWNYEPERGVSNLIHSDYFV
jgi:hypothetical protein